MATVSVITLAALTAYIVLGLLALARVPDAGGPARRLIQLAIWPAVVLRAAAAPSHRHAREVPTEVDRPVAAHSAAGHVPAAVAAVAAQPQAGDGPSATAPAAIPATPPAATATPAPQVPPPAEVAQEPPRDLRHDWERFVNRLTEPSE